MSQERRSYEDHDDYFNAQFGAKPVYISAGEQQSGQGAGEMFVATIGAGVAVSIYDKDLHVGGMAYVLMPDSLLEAFPNFRDCDPDLIAQACKPIDDCLRSLKQMGAGKNRIRIRLIGGFDDPEDECDRGTKNYIFVREYLSRKKLPVMSEDLSGSFIRRVHFFPSSGRAVRHLLRRESDFAAIRRQETLDG